MKAGNSRVLRTIPLVLIALLFSFTAYGKVIYVDDDAVGANNGTSWENAYVYLQDALMRASEGDEVRVAQGIYKPDQFVLSKRANLGRKETFQLMDEVAIRGGYAGFGEADPDAHDVQLYETILSGDLNGDDTEILNASELLFDKTRLENAYHVLTAYFVDANSTLDGFTITGGNADKQDGHTNGGGIYCNSSNLEILNCVFQGNTAEQFGGAIYIYYSSEFIVENCKFVCNASSSGGAIRSELGDPDFRNCSFIENISGGSGGAVLSSSGTPSFINCRFDFNSSDMGGGIYTFAYCDLMLTNCTFTGNSATYYGGGVYNKTHIDKQLIMGCMFKDNYAGYLGGGLYNTHNSNSIVQNCLFVGNSSGSWGGGIHFYDCNSEVINCTLVNNEAAKGGAVGFGFFNEKLPSNVKLSNCILWDNGQEIYNDDESFHDITYSCIQGFSFGRSSKNNGIITSVPCFISLGCWAHIEDVNVAVEPNDPNALWVEGDYHLKSQAGRWDPNSESWVLDDVTSPCIDAGDPNSPVGDEPEPNGGRINMGAYGGTAEASKSGSAWWFETTQGPIVAEGLGVILPHEHIFTDLRGPGTRGYGQADAADVVRVMAPLLEEAKLKGVGLLFECSSIGVGRNASILSEVSATSGLPVVVPTGVYGRANFAPVEHRDMSEDELTQLFISEIREGIEGTGIKAGFIKIATGGGNMTALEEKFLRAAGRAARETGAAVASHTTVSNNATRQADILESISPEIRFIWVHAQSVNNRSLYRQLAGRGVFIEFDSLDWNPGQDSTFISAIKDLLAGSYGEQILLSHDAGWYQPREQNGGTQMPYTYLIDTFIPKLRDSGVDDEAIRMITEINPIRAFGFNQDVNP